MAFTSFDFTNSEIFVYEWVDPVLTATGFDASSEYVETYWLGMSKDWGWGSAVPAYEKVYQSLTSEPGRF